MQEPIQFIPTGLGNDIRRLLAHWSVIEHVVRARPRPLDNSIFSTVFVPGVQEAKDLYAGPPQ